MVKKNFGGIQSFDGGRTVEEDAEMEYDDALEDEYEKSKESDIQYSYNKLPIKTHSGFVYIPDIDDKDFGNKSPSEDEPTESETQLSDEAPKILTAAQLFEIQNKLLESKKIQVGSLSSGLLENPGQKMHNFKTLFAILKENIGGNGIAVKKLIVVSLVEVFKDILPSYQIKQLDKGVKLKKETLKLEKFETSLLLYYRKFLQILENFSYILFKKHSSTISFLKAERNFGELCVGALCDLLEAHSYFNYAENIVRTIVPFLNHSEPRIRLKVNATFKNIFKVDKKGDISLRIVRLINQLVKKQSFSVHIQVLEVLVHLHIKEINLDQEQENQKKQKKLMSHKSNVMRLSKMEKKKKVQLQHLEKELLEVKAEESYQMKTKNQTEIVKVIFGIFFRILKNTENTKLLDVCLQGVAKYAHCINVEFYVDLINVLDNLLNTEWLGYTERQRCIQTVFIILSEQGQALNIDPTRFYSGIYNNLLTISSAHCHENFDVVIETLILSLVKRHKKISVKRTVGFLKRIATLGLQLLHNGTLSSLAIIRVLLQVNRAADILLDLDSSTGDGPFLPELDNPEYCNASSTALFELTLLRKHYHPIVVQYSKLIVSSASVPLEKETSRIGRYDKSNPGELYTEFNTAEMCFNPPVPTPKSGVKRKTVIIDHQFCDSSFKQKCYSFLKHKT